ncbi:hypothetical protein M408DRAFT_233137 [Serendipita vermifera MAFF 305830]|uniref:Uncharacterized protein n=1 Tax=Serendipita vermifera MAFF 305830 TaxID=933852 RepID=A0A0C2WD37_SERVB|nr:hypothetical protein M408DRAFT_233137 [Serendipita vermifera MAFF 305830]
MTIASYSSLVPFLIPVDACFIPLMCHSLHLILFTAPRSQSGGLSCRSSPLKGHPGSVHFEGLIDRPDFIIKYRPSKQLLHYSISRNKHKLPQRKARSYNTTSSPCLPFRQKRKITL